MDTNSKKTYTQGGCSSSKQSGTFPPLLFSWNTTANATPQHHPPHPHNAPPDPLLVHPHIHRRYKHPRHVPLRRRRVAQLRLARPAQRPRQELERLNVVLAFRDSPPDSYGVAACNGEGGDEGGGEVAGVCATCVVRPCDA